jgi:hypothetical protein
MNSDLCIITLRGEKAGIETNKEGGEGNAILELKVFTFSFPRQRHTRPWLVVCSLRESRARTLSGGGRTWASGC